MKQKHLTLEEKEFIKDKLKKIGILQKLGKKLISIELQYQTKY